MSELWYIPDIHTLVTSGTISTYYQRSLGTPLTVPNSKESFIFLHEAFCSLGIFVQKYFRQNFPTQWSFIKNLFENNRIHWPMGTLENVSIFFPAVL